MSIIVNHWPESIISLVIVTCGIVRPEPLGHWTFAIIVRLVEALLLLFWWIGWWITVWRWLSSEVVIMFFAIIRPIGRRGEQWPAQLLLLSFESTRLVLGIETDSLLLSNRSWFWWALQSPVAIRVSSWLYAPLSVAMAVKWMADWGRRGRTSCELCKGVYDSLL